MEPRLPGSGPVTRRRVLARGCLGGAALSIVLWFVWWQLLGKVWTDCQAGDSIQRGALILLGSPLVILSSALVFAVSTALFGRQKPRTAAIVGLTLAVITTYLWFAWIVPQAVSVSFSGPPTSTCPGNVPPWWPSWLPV
jgi:high-affinity Fe2+/Pb2+ permease